MRDKKNGEIYRSKIWHYGLSGNLKGLGLGVWEAGTRGILLRASILEYFTLN